MKKHHSIETWLNGVDETDPRQVLKSLYLLTVGCGDAMATPANRRKVAGQVIATWWPKTVTPTQRPLRPRAARALKELEHIVAELLVP